MGGVVGSDQGAYELRLPFSGYVLIYAYELVQTPYVWALGLALVLLLVALTAPFRRRWGMYVTLIIGVVTWLYHSTFDFSGMRAEGSTEMPQISFSESVWKCGVFRSSVSRLSGRRGKKSFQTRPFRNGIWERGRKVRA